MSIFFCGSNVLYLKPDFYRAESTIKTVKEYAEKYQNTDAEVSFLVVYYNGAGYKKLMELAAVKVTGDEENLLITEEKQRNDSIRLSTITGNYLARSHDWISLRAMQMNIDEYNNSSSAEELELKNRIKEFVSKKNAYRDFHKEVSEQILGQPNLNQVTYNIFMWLKGIAYGTDIKNNIMLAAPSGCGKTETYRVINEIFKKKIGNIPVLQFDMTHLTPEGFSGKNTEDFFKPLIENTINGIAVVVLDELDKKLVPCFEKNGGNVNASVQAQILTLIEGKEFQKGNKSINTKNTMFIGAGAFQELRDNRKKEKKSRIGFYDGDFETAHEIEFKELTVEDIMQAGAMKEFMGRFTTVINYYELNKECVNKLVKRYASEFENKIGYKIKVSNSGVDSLYNKYRESSLGCRILKSEIWNRLSGTGINIELMSNEEKKDIDCIHISAEGTKVVMKKKEKGKRQASVVKNKEIAGRCLA